MFDLFNLLPPTGWFEAPASGVEVSVCPESGFLAGRDCPGRIRIKAPDAAAHASICPWHREIAREKWFVLPPLQEKYYRVKHQEYRPLPEEVDSGTEALAYSYPADGAVLSAARQMDGSLPGIRCEAVHSRQGATVYWHLDNTYLGETKGIHTMQVDMPPGIHRLTIVDDAGSRKEITVKILQPAMN